MRRKKSKIIEHKSKKPLFDLDPHTKKAIWAVIFLAVSVILFLSLWHKAGLAGEWLSRFFSYSFGWGDVILPFVFVAISFEFLRSERKHIYFATFFGAILFFISLLGFINLFSAGSGGIVGYGASLALGKLFGFWASAVLFAAFIIASLLMMLNFPLRIGRAGGEEDEEDEEAVAEDEESKTKEPVASRASANLHTSIPVKSAAAELGLKKKVDENEDELKIPRLISKTYTAPTADLLEREEGKALAGDIKASANIIKRTLEHFGMEVEMGEVNVGPTITQFTLRPAQGVKLSKIVSLHNDLALALAAHPLRIEAPIPGKALVGIEVPNKTIALVRLGSLIASDFFQKTEGILTFAIGRDVSGSAFFGDLSKMPHLLIAGATGSGKSVCIHSLIISLLWRNGPALLKFIMIDPKRVELSHYKEVAHLLTPVISDGKRAIQALRWTVKEMERRYELLSAEEARDIAGFNTRAAKNPDWDILPYIVIVIDELADLMSAYGREVEGMIIRLAQMARAVGIHLVVSTQRPSVEVITGLIKANITTRIAFQVASQVDSRTILDMAGAEKLLGNGDMLYLAGDASKPRRIQGVYVSEKEIKKIAEFIRKNNKPESSQESKQDLGGDMAVELDNGRYSLDLNDAEEWDEPEDEMYEEAKRVVIEAQKASASLLQRRLRVGYARAARLLDILEERSIIGPGDGAKPREVHIKNDQ